MSKTQITETENNEENDESELPPSKYGYKTQKYVQLVPTVHSSESDHYLWDVLQSKLIMELKMFAFFVLGGGALGTFSNGIGHAILEGAGVHSLYTNGNAWWMGADAGILIGFLAYGIYKLCDWTCSMSTHSNEKLSKPEQFALLFMTVAAILLFPTVANPYLIHPFDLDDPNLWSFITRAQYADIFKSELVGLVLVSLVALAAYGYSKKEQMTFSASKLNLFSQSENRDSESSPNSQSEDDTAADSNNSSNFKQSAYSYVMEKK